jgi:uncharacterized protein (DUF433 family)
MSGPEFRFNPFLCTASEANGMKSAKIDIRRSVMESLDWSKCPLVEIDPWRVSGRPVLKGTRMPVEDIIANYEYGVSIDEISIQFQIPASIVRELLTYAKT